MPPKDSRNSDHNENRDGDYSPKDAPAEECPHPPECYALDEPGQGWCVPCLLRESTALRDRAEATEVALEWLLFAAEQIQIPSDRWDTWPDDAGVLEATAGQLIDAIEFALAALAKKEGA